MRNLVTGLVFGSGLLLLLAFSGSKAGANEIDRAPFWLAQAEGYASQIQVPDGRAALLVSIGTGYVNLGAKDAARDLLRRALDYGKQCTGCYGKARRLAEIGLLLDQAGDPMSAASAFDAAREAAEALEDPLDRIAAGCVIVARMADSGDVMPARIQCAEIHEAAKPLEGLARVQACASLVEAWLAVGAFDKAEAVLLRMRLERVEGEDVRALRSEAGFALVQAASEAGKLRKGREVAEGIQDPDLRLAALLELADAEEHGSEPVSLDAARRLATSFEAPVPRARALLDVADTAIRIGATVAARPVLQQAIGVIDSLGEEKADQVTLLLTYVTLRHRAGETYRATEAHVRSDRLMEGGWKGLERPNALRRRSAAVWAQGGRFIEAERMARSIDDPFVGLQTRLDLAEAYRRTGRRNLAYVTASAVGRRVAAYPGGAEGDQRATCAELLRRVAVLQAGNARYEEALLTVNAIDRPFQAATACTYIARDLTEGVEED